MAAVREVIEYVNSFPGDVRAAYALFSSLISEPYVLEMEVFSILTVLNLILYAKHLCLSKVCCEEFRLIKNRFQIGYTYHSQKLIQFQKK